MAPFTFDRPPLIIGPVSGVKHSATCIILHGYGDDADGWEHLGRRASPLLPHVKFVFPNANQQSWFDFSLGPHSDVTTKTLLDARDTVVEMIEKEIASGIKSYRILLGGFSQGGAVSLLVSTTAPSHMKLAAVLPIATFLPLSEPPPTPSTADVTPPPADSKSDSEPPLPPLASHTTPTNKDTVHLWLHGEADAMVPIQRGAAACEMLKRLGFEKTFMVTYKGVGHWTSERMVENVVRFVEKMLGAEEDQEGKTAA